MELVKTQRKAPSTLAFRAMLNIQDVCTLTRRGKTWVYEAVKHGRFPAPARLSRRCTRWDSAEVEAWIAEQFQSAK